jgi:predicted Zn-dependent peptidase
MSYSEFRKTVLDNGLTIVTERLPHVRSVSLGVWVKTGSRFEPSGKNGVAHFLEHMMFKSTERRSAREIVRQIEALGGMINAFTTKEQTCFTIDVLDSYFDKSLNILTDILYRQDFSEKDVEKERLVILDEIQSAEEIPEDVLSDIFSERLFPDHAIGNPILGTKQSVSEITKSDLLDFYRKHYNYRQTVVAAAGNIDHERLVGRLKNKLKLNDTDYRAISQLPTQFGKGAQTLHRNLVQSHICIGVPTFSYNDPRKFELLLLNHIFGEGMGSRLFQNIRERYGIAYAIYSFLEFFSDCGYWGVYLATDPKNVRRAEDLLNRELDKFVEKGVTKRELAEAKSSTIGNMILRLENTAARMNRLAMMEIYEGQFRDIDWIIDNIQNVTEAQMNRVIAEILDHSKRLTVKLTPSFKKRLSKITV